MKIYPKKMYNTEKLSFYFGEAYGKEFVDILAREPEYTYMAYLTQTGTDAPVAEVLFNNLETLPVYAYESQGTYKILHPFITYAKTIVSCSNAQIVDPYNHEAVIWIKNQGEVNIATPTTDRSTADDDQLLNTFVKIEIWL